MKKLFTSFSLTELNIVVLDFEMINCDKFNFAKKEITKFLCSEGFELNQDYCAILLYFDIYNNLVDFSVLEKFRYINKSIKDVSDIANIIIIQIIHKNNDIYNNFYELYKIIDFSNVGLMIVKNELKESIISYLDKNLYKIFNF